MFQMISQQHSITLELENGTLDLRSGELSVTDSKAGNSVKITGLAANAVDREVSYWVSSKRYAHNRAAQQESLDFLNRLAETCNEAIKYLNDKVSEAAS